MLQNIVYVISIIVFVIGVYFVYISLIKKKIANPELLKQPFPEKFREILNSRIRYYQKLSKEQKVEFENRILRFMAEKKISGVETEVSDEDRIMVASSAIIPMFAFPYFSYPSVKEVLLYPHSFDDEFHTDNKSDGRNILGMVGDGFLKGNVLLSKADLELAFDGNRHKSNVGIHEFIHLIDKADGSTDGIPDILFEHSFSISWIKEIKKEINKIEHGHSDISPYALTNNAEFLAVVAEYFFDNPEKMKSRHLELYNYLVKIFHQHPDDYV